MQFSASPKGYHVLAYNSSRVYVFDVREQDLHVKREFKIMRRPALACITDDASTLAVLSSEMQLNVYDLRDSPPTRRNAMILDNPPRAIALSACGNVLATAHETGIEVSSLTTGAMPTDRRSVKCDPVDSLAFSFDGTQILGTTIHSQTPSTVVITAPYFDPGNLLAGGDIMSMWTTSILFPNTSHDSSHAVLLQNGMSEEATWAFTYDRSFEAFRAIRIEDLRNGTTYFTGPVPLDTSQSQLLPCTAPTASYLGQVAAAGFQGNQVWIYGIPEDLDAIPGSPAATTTENLSVGAVLGRRTSQHSSVSRNGSGRSRDAPAPGSRMPQWQILCDKLRNNFVSGYKVSELTGLSTLKWVAGQSNSSSIKERLVATARGVSGPLLATDEEDIDFVDGGRIVLFDFDYDFTDGHKREITMELGTENPEPLEEEKRDIETEVAIVRRRTVAQRRNQNPLLRAATTASRDAAAIPPLPQNLTNDSDDDPLLPRRMGQNPSNQATPVVDDDDDDDEGVESPSIDEMDALDAPYAHASPRSGTTLRRAATAAAVNRARNPRTADGRPIEYRRADGRREHPHPADGDNWVPPPPPYQREDPGDMPSFLRGPAIAPLAYTPALPTAFPNFTNSDSLASLQRRQSRQRTASDSTTYSARPRLEDFARPRSSPSVPPEQFQPFAISPINSHSALSPTLDTPVLTLDEDAIDDSPIFSATGGLPPIQRDEDRPSSMDTFVSSQRTTTTHTEPSSADNRQQHIPVLDVQIPPLHTDLVPQAASIRRLSNVQTWPLAPQPEANAADTAPVSPEPQSAPAIDFTPSAFASALPPAPSSEQLARLHRRISLGGVPNRRSVGASSSWAAEGSKAIEAWQSQASQSITEDEASSRPILGPNEEVPMIISTPRGVSGAFDPPENSVYRTRSIENPILAPIPRRPRPNIAFNPRPNPPQLQPLYPPSVVQQSQQLQQQQLQQLQKQKRRATLLPSWLSSPPSSSSRASLSRRPSRAERSAAKNMHDARKRGWRPKSKKGNQPGDVETSSTGDWADVSPTAAPKEKRCIVM